MVRKQVAANLSSKLSQAVTHMDMAVALGPSTFRIESKALVMITLENLLLPSKAVDRR
jgi:hypothetical protein